MANYKLDYTGEQINTAIGNALSGGGGTQLYRHEIYCESDGNPYYINFISNRGTQYEDIESLFEDLRKFGGAYISEGETSGYAFPVIEYDFIFPSVCVLLNDNTREHISNFYYEVDTVTPL